MLNKVSQYHSEKENIEDLSHEQAQECCKMLKAITLAIVSKIDDKLIEKSVLLSQDVLQSEIFRKQAKWP